MSEITLTPVPDEGKIKVVSPYHKHFVDRARYMRGQFKDGAWYFDDSITEYVRELMIECYGVSGEDSYNNVTLLVKDFDDRADKGAVTLFGRTIAKAWGRDSGAKLGDDIILIKGDVRSGGSVKNWLTYVNEATFEIRRFPEPALAMPEVAKAIEEGWVEVKRMEKKDPEAIQQRIKALEAEIETLKSQLV